MSKTVILPNLIYSKICTIKIQNYGLPIIMDFAHI